MSKYYLVPGTKIGAKGLPGGEIKADKTARKISDTELECFEDSLEYLIATGKVVEGEPEEIETADNEEEKGKSEKRLALEANATELGIEFNDKTANKVLAEMIATEMKRAREELEANATELGIEFNDKTTDEELKSLIKKELE